MIPPTTLRLAPPPTKATAHRLRCHACQHLITVRELRAGHRNYLWFGCDTCGNGHTYIIDPAPAPPPVPIPPKKTKA